MKPDVTHRLLDILAVLVFTGVAYAALKVVSTRFDTEGWVVFVIFLTAVADKLGLRSVHKMISKRLE